MIGVMRPNPRRAVIGALLLLAAVLASCAKTDDGIGGSGSTGTLPTIVIKRTGGIAGFNDTYTVDNTGVVTHTNKAGASTTATLSADQIGQLIHMAADPRLTTEAKRQPSPTNCSDAFNYVVTVGTHTISYTDCPSDADQPVATQALVDMVTSAGA